LRYERICHFWKCDYVGQTLNKNNKFSEVIGLIIWQNKYLAIKTCFLKLDYTPVIINVATITLGKKSKFVAKVCNFFLVVKVTFMISYHLILHKKLHATTNCKWHDFMMTSHKFSSSPKLMYMVSFDGWIVYILFIR